MRQAPPTWPEKLECLRGITDVIDVKLIDPFAAPEAGTFLEMDGSKYLITKSQTLDGVVFGVANSRSQCLVAVELPGGSAVTVTAHSPTVLETLVPQVFQILDDSFALCTSERMSRKVP